MAVAIQVRTRGLSPLFVPGLTILAAAVVAAQLLQNFDPRPGIVAFSRLQ